MALILPLSLYTLRFHVSFSISSIMFYEMLLQVGAQHNVVMCCSVAISFFDISGICTFTNMMYNVVDLVLTASCHISRGGFRVVAKCNGLNFVTRLSFTISGPPLSVNSSYGHTCRRIFSR